MCSAHDQVYKVNPVNRVGYVSTVHKYSSVNGLGMSERGQGRNESEGRSASERRYVVPTVSVSNRSHGELFDVRSFAGRTIRTPVSGGSGGRCADALNLENFSKKFLGFGSNRKKFELFRV